MASCEMCGAVTNSLTPIRVAGSTMQVCSNCKHLGTETEPKQEDYSHTFYRKKKTQTDNQEVVSNYQSLIQSALAKKGLNLKQLARAVNIKESTLNNYASGKIKPDLQNAQKIQNFLDITLITEQDNLDDNYEDFTNNDNEHSNTLGDMLLKELNK